MMLFRGLAPDSPILQKDIMFLMSMLEYVRITVDGSDENDWADVAEAVLMVERACRYASYKRISIRR